MKRVVKNIILLVLLFVLSSCGKKSYVVFDYNCNGREYHKCELKDNKINCYVDTPTCSGYKFKGWYRANEYKTTVDLNGTFNVNEIIYARWEKEGESQSSNIEERSTIIRPIDTDIPSSSKEESSSSEEPSSSREEPSSSQQPIDPPAPEETYTISFNLNGGSGGQAASISGVKYNQTLPSISQTKPSRGGHIFTGWYDKQTGGTQYYNSSNSPVRKYDKKSNITLYAGWNACPAGKYAQAGATSCSECTGNTYTSSTGQSSCKSCPFGQNVNSSHTGCNAKIYTVTLNNQGATSAGTSTIYLKYNTGWYSNSSGTTSITKITKPTKTGYLFGGYYTNANGGGTQIIDSSGTILSGKTNAFNSNTSLYAKWTPCVLSIQYNGNGGTWNSSASGSEYGVNSSGTVIVKSTNKVYQQQLNYGLKLESSGLIDYNGTWFNWTRSGYIVEDKKEYIIGSTTLDQNKVYSAVELANYAGCDLSKTNCTITVKVNWIKSNDYTITYYLNGGTNPSGVKTRYTKNDDTYTLPIPTKSGYVFAGWYMNSGFTDMPVLQLVKGSTGNKKFYARWTTTDKFIVKYDCNGGSGAPDEEIITKGDIFVPKVNTCVKSGKEFYAWLNAAGDDWTLRATTDFKNGKYGITNNTIILKAKWLKELKKNNNAIKPNLTGKTKITCANLLDRDKSPKNLTNVYCEYETSTLKYTLVKPEWNYILTYIWVKDTYSQSKMAIATAMSSSSISKRNLWNTYKIVENEIKSKKYESKALVGFNADPMVSERFYTAAPYDWKYGPAIQYFKNDGVVIRNSVNNTDDSKNTYWLSGYRYIGGINKDGYLKHYTWKMRSSDTEYTEAKRAVNSRIVEYIEKEGINNTFSWTGTYDILNYESGSPEEKITSFSSGKGASPAICQMDLNNFIFITQAFNNGDVGGRDGRKTYGVDTLEVIKGLGCNRALRVDGGGSTAIWAKSNSSNKATGPGRAYDGRNSCDLLYFVEK